MNNNIEERLVNIAASLKPGQTSKVILETTQIDLGSKSKLICKISNFGNPAVLNEGNIIPFTATKEGSANIVVRGKIDAPTVKKVKTNGQRLKLLRDFVAQKIQEISSPEDDYDKIYIDDKGREYEIRNGAKAYLDDRGFYYYVKCDLAGNEYEWIKLTDYSEGVFLDPERKIIKVHDKAYYFDGNIHFDKEIDPINFHR